MRHFFPLVVLFSTLGSVMIWGILNGFYLENGSIMTVSWIVNSDWMMHLTQVQNFSTLPFWYVATHHPLYSGDILSYPFFVNWISGILLFFTDHLVFSMVLPMIIGSVLFVVAIYFLFWTLLQNRFSSVVAFFLFFFTGGLQFLDVASLWTWKEFQTLHDYKFDQAMISLGYYWKSFFLTTLLPQRAYLWGMGVGALALSLFFQRFIPILLEEKQQNTAGIYVFSFAHNSYFFLIGLLLGSLAVIHTHSFLYCFLFFVGLTLFYIRYFFIFISLAIGAFITAFPFIFLLLQKKSTVSEISLFPLEQLANDSFFHFWHLNWGIFFWSVFLFFLPGIWNVVFGKEPSKRKTLLIHLFIITCILFIAFSALKMQSNPWDNTKLWLWNALFFSLFVASFITFMWQKHILGKIGAVALFITSVASGMIMLISGLNDTPTQVFSKQELALAQDVKKIVNPKDIIMSSDYFHLPFTCLIPKQTFLGYRGWIASYGMDISHKTALLERVYAGGPNAIAILQRENIRYVLVDDSIRSMFAVNDAFFATQMQLKIDLQEWGTLYEVPQ